MKQHYDAYKAGDHAVWKILFERQIQQLRMYADPVYLDCISKLEGVLHADAIPEFEALSSRLNEATGWKIHVVPGLIPVKDFFELMAQRKWCSSTWVRRMDQLDYLEEPDMFHDIFGHVPLLMHQPYADFMQAFGELGVSVSDDPEMIDQLERLYWYTIEFGIMRNEDKLKIYGAGILSSYGETKHVVEDDVTFNPYDTEVIASRPFRKDVIQDEYFFIRRYEELFGTLEALEGRFRPQMSEPRLKD